MKTKTFDCVQMKRQGAELVRNKLEGKSPKEILAYWQKGTAELKERQRRKKNSK
jgi:hypothetical protein